MSWLILLAAAAAQPQGATAQQFIAGVFANYHDANFSPLAHPKRYFAPRLVAAIAADARLAHGEVGYLDGDPVCRCQDSGGIDATIIRAATERHGKARVDVLIHWQSDPPTKATYSLVRTRSGWRIADVAAAGEPSLLGALEASNRKMKAKKGRHAE